MNSQPKVVWVTCIFTRKFAQIEFYWRETSTDRREARLLIQNESWNLAVQIDNFLEFKVWKYPKYNFKLKTYK